MSPSLSSRQETAACHRGLGVRAHVMQETHMAVPGWNVGRAREDGQTGFPQPGSEAPGSALPH